MGDGDPKRGRFLPNRPSGAVDYPSGGALELTPKPGGSHPGSVPVQATGDGDGPTDAVDHGPRGRGHIGGVKRPSTAVQPPSTKSWLPVTKDDASEARYTTAPASSSGLDHRPSALLAA